MKWVGLVAEKYTHTPLSDTFEVDADNIFAAANEIERLSGITVDGSTNFVDVIEIES